MNKRVYWVISIIFLGLLALNVFNDKYYMDYVLTQLTINNPSESNSSRAVIYGDETNEGVFIETPKVDLPKGEYLITIKYSADTDSNYISLKGKGISTTPMIEEGNQYLAAADNGEKVIRIQLEEDVHNFKALVNFCGKGTLVFNNITIESAKITYTDTLVWIFIAVILLTIIYRLLFCDTIKERKQKLLVLLCLIAITIMASYPMFLDYLVRGHDISFHLTRIEGIKSGLLAGQFPVRLHNSTLYNYGYATSIFYPELFLYLPAFLRIIGVTVTGTVQIFVIFINFATAGVMYFSTYRIFKVRSIGILSSILYVLASYHLCDLYTRFALGEALAMIFLPLVIYGVYELLHNDYTKWEYAVIGATGVLQSHILSTLITAALVMLAVLVCLKKLADKNRIYACIKAAIATLLLNLWFLVPFITMMREDMNVASLGRDVDKLSLYVTQLFQNFTMNGESRNIIGTDLEGVMPLQIGFPIVLGVMLVFYVIVTKKRNEAEEKLVLVLFSIGSLCALATTNLFPWKLLVSIPVIGKMARMIQFPWRLLAFAIAFLSIVAAYGIHYIISKEEIRKVLVVAIFSLSALIASHYFDNFIEKDIYCYKGAVKVNTGIGTGEYYYSGTDTDKLIKRGERIDTSSGEIVVSQFERKDNTFDLTIENNSQTEQYLEVPLAYYPFYDATMDGENLEVTKGDNNVVRIIVPAGLSGTIQIYYKANLSWQISDFISLASLLVLVFGVTYKFRKKYVKTA